MPHAKEVLSEIHNLKNKKVAAVFDLDSTLYCVSVRTEKIMRDFADDPLAGTRFPHQKRILKTIQVLPSDWGIRESLIRAGIEAPLDFFEELRNYWRKHFFSSPYLKCDLPYEGAVRYVQAISEAGVPILYLTGRDRPDMYHGTIESLKAHGFPLEKDEHLYMKPYKNSHEDEDYKVQILSQLKQDFEHIFFFENEPVIINRVLKAAIPGVDIIFMDTVHSRREEVSGLRTIKGRFVF